jgi:protein-disulfide isomerase
MNEHVHVGRVREDFLSGVRSGVNGTPTFFVNGVRHNGPIDAAGLLEAVERAAAAT